MKRDLQEMAAKAYDVVVVGGGITGACVARDAALRGLSVALVEKRDFAGATTAASSKLIHGGLRYLQNLELGIVRESLRERRIWSNAAPHLVDPITFLMPTTGTRIRDRLMKAIGLTLYDWLAYDRNRLDDPAKEIPSHKKLNRRQAIALEPGLKSDELTGAMEFYDYQMYSPERLALDCLLSAVEHGADVANYAEVVGFVVEDGRVAGVRVRDAASQESKEASEPRAKCEVRGQITVNATGPWADVLMVAARGVTGSTKEAPRRLIRSKGIHLITRALTREHAIAVPGESTHFFILPWRGYSILGTTDTVYEGDPDDVHVSEKDIVDFLAVVNGGFPGANLRRSDVLYFYAGLRPIVAVQQTGPEKVEGDTESNEEDVRDKEDGEEPESYSASRAAEVYDHEREEGIKGILTAIGGKWTTSRRLAEQVVGLAASKLGKSELQCATEETPTYGGDVGRFASFKKQAVAQHLSLPADIVENLAKNYGSHMGDVLALIEEDAALAERISDQFPDIAAQVVHAVRHEMALTVEDVLFRRTGLGTLGHPGDHVIERVRELMARELEWDETAKTAHADRAVARFVSWARTRAIVNPRSWGNRTGAIWPAIEVKLRHAIGPVDAVFTQTPMDAKRLTTEALRDGMEQIIAVGGDGTVNEVVNGFFEDGRPINPEAMLAFLTSGTGKDFSRTFQTPDDVEDQIERLATSEIRSIDLGKLTYTDEDGNECVRLFDNVASFGLGGATDLAVNRLRWAKKFGGKFAFRWGMFKALLHYQNRDVRIQVDDVFDEVVNTNTAAVCNGQFFGSGMRIAPNAQVDDGLFDVVIVADIGRLELLRQIGSVYRGEHLVNEHVTELRGQCVRATPIDRTSEVLLDVDGENSGRLPATFEMMPNALFVRS